MKNPKQKRRIAALCAPLGGVSAIILLAGGARAQAAAPAASDDGAVLQQIVVTADRKSYSADFVQAGSFRGAKQLDTPLTVSVIPEEVLAPGILPQIVFLFTTKQSGCGRAGTRAPVRGREDQRG